MKWLIPVLSGLVFLVTGLALIPWPGLQNDELFFSGPIYAPGAAYYSIELASLKIPFMVMSYSGALKTWLYGGLFQFLAPTVWSIRIPMLLAGLATIFLTWIWVREIAGPRAAAVAAVLLATDTIFLITGVFDAGPVALQHLFLIGGLVSIQKWLKYKTNSWLALGFFLWGLGMWDKALMAWPLIALAVSSFCVFPRKAVSEVRFVPVAIALASFLLGAAPLVWYNLDRPGETATQNAKFAPADVRGKVVNLQQTIDGSALFGYMVYEDSVTGKREPRRWSQRFPVWLSRVAGNHRTNWMLPAWALGFVFTIFLWNTDLRRTLLFLLVVLTLGWAEMALTKGAGGASHHVILLWPFPAVWLGIAFAAMADRAPHFGRPALAALVLFLAVTNLLNTNQYLSRFIVNGPSGGWTDAIFPLASSIADKSAPWFGLVDWGYLNGLRTLHEGDLPLFIVDVNADKKDLEKQIGSSEYVFIQHTDDKQMFPGINDRLRKAAAQLGYVEHVDRAVADRNGRPVFELFRFERQ